MPPPPTWPLVQSALHTTVTRAQRVPGGDINHAFRLTLANGQTVFAKHNPQAHQLPGLFDAEAAGLNALRQHADALQVPRVLAHDDTCLLLEAIDRPGPADEADLGRGLAQLHHAATHTRFGFHRANYLGRLPQPNDRNNHWPTFWRDQRLLPLANTLTDPALRDAVRRLADRVPALLADAPDEPPTLIHGDLWSGNACTDPQGQTWLYDPACYYAHREAELGMTRLFGFGPAFEHAYHNTYPLAQGYEQRAELYRLHHLLSHAWHFAGHYTQQALQLAHQLLNT